MAPSLYLCGGVLHREREPKSRHQHPACHPLSSCLGQLDGRLVAPSVRSRTCLSACLLSVCIPFCVRVPFASSSFHGHGCACFFLSLFALLLPHFLFHAFNRTGRKRESLSCPSTHLSTVCYRPLLHRWLNWIGQPVFILLLLRVSFLCVQGCVFLCRCF